MLGISAYGYGGAAALWRTAYASQNAPSAGAAVPVEPEEPAGQAVPARTAMPAPYTPELPEAAPGFGPEELANRVKLRYPGEEAPLFQQSRLAGLENGLARVQGKLEEADRTGDGKGKTPQEVMEEEECQTCARRRYQDGSDDPGVSFKTPTKVDPSQAESAVRSHEHEHVVRERAEAEREGKKVVSQYVTYKSGICPECGKVYVAGGETHTVTAKDPAAEREDGDAPAKPRFEATA